MEKISLKEIIELYNLNKIINKEIIFYGWIRRIRIGGAGKLIFIDIYDGTIVGSLMGIISKDNYEIDNNTEFTKLEFEQLSKSEYISDGSSVEVKGILQNSPENTTQQFELHIKNINVINNIDNPLKYPIQKSSEKQLITLRQYPFYRIRTQLIQSIFRINSVLEYGIHTFMFENNIQKIDPNIITTSDCEGAGETFMISPLIFSQDKDNNFIPVGLTVSSQLPLESAIIGFKQVYTSQKSFRAEKSDTIKHLSEFLHIEYESAFITLNELIDFTEKFVKYIIKFTINKTKMDFEFLESKMSSMDIKPTRKLLEELIEKPFIRIKHCDAVKLINNLITTKFMLPDENNILKKIKVNKLPTIEDDLGTEHEKILVKYFGYMSYSEKEREIRLKNNQEFGAFVFVTHYPLKIKSFYMKQIENSLECESFDLLAPRVGELFGGSMREWRYTKLMEEINRRNMNIKPIEWYIELRKNGSIPHGGWGMGFSRMAMLLTGVPSIRDTVFLPVYYGNCPY